jgi:hypothetical protein
MNDPSAGEAHLHTGLPVYQSASLQQDQISKDQIAYSLQGEPFCFVRHAPRVSSVVFG